MNSWYSIKAKADEADVLIYNEIGGWGITAEMFANELKAIKAKTINVHINSPGGSVFDGFAIYNALRSHEGKVITHVDGLAASSASVIALAGKDVRIAKNGYLMIHNATMGVFGDAEDMRKNADFLQKINVTIADIYAARTGKSQKEMLDMMDDETWFDANEAKAIGLVDVVKDEDGNLPAVAAATTKYHKTPENIRRIAAMLTTGQGDNPAARAAGTEAANKEEVLMNLENFKAFAAEHPEAVASYIEQGKKAGKAEARADFKALVDAAGGNVQLAIDAFNAGQDADQVKATAAAIAKATAEKDAEIERLKALAGSQGAVNTSSAAASAAADANKPGKPDASDPKALAEWEWANEKPQGFSSKERYISARVAELSGKMSVFSRK